MISYKVIVDYTLTLAEMIVAGNHGRFWDENDDSRFPLQGTGQHEVELVLVPVYLNQDVETWDVLEYMDSQGLEPANIEQLLAFGTTYPKIRREFSIVALGSSTKGRYHRYYPCLVSYDGRRDLHLCQTDDHPWDGESFFLAVRTK